MSTIKNNENGTETGQTTNNAQVTRLAKTHQDFWKDRLRHRDYVGRDGIRVQIPEWQVRMHYLRREAWFNLATPNKAAAAIKARDLYLSLVSTGWDATLAKFKPDPLEKVEVCTVGEFLGDVAARAGLKPKTWRGYATKLRKIVSDVAGLEVGLKKKARRKKYDYAHGGRTAWVAKVHAQRLDVLTPASVTLWRNRHAAKAGSDPMRRKSAERTAASILRCARALFAPDVLGCLKVKLPPNPFAGVRLNDPGAARYHSQIDPALLLLSAARELRLKQPQLFLALWLCFWGGLRRKEADLLLWSQVDFASGQIHVRRTAFFEPKTEESQRCIDLCPVAIEGLREFMASARGEFVLAGNEPNTAATYAYYRCDSTWRALNAWLRLKGISQTKAVHALRKESGSLIAANLGIEAARHHLGHTTITTTSDHYVGKKSRIQVELPCASGSRPALASLGQRETTTALPTTQLAS